MCAVQLSDIKTNIAENRVESIVSEPYQNIFNKAYQIMNSREWKELNLQKFQFIYRKYAK